MKDFKLLLHLIAVNVKMFMRDKGALFWSLFFPILIIGIFGVLDFTSLDSNEIGLVYTEENKQYAEQLRDVFESSDDYKFHTGSIDEEKRELEEGARFLVLEFVGDESDTMIVNSYMSKENEQTGEIVTLITEKILGDISLQMQGIELPFEVKREVVNTNDLKYIDFIVPGIIALSVMQGALFGVIGTIVVNREKGVLRRVFATPLKKSTFLISNIFARTFISVAQILILLGLSSLIFDIKIVGSLIQVIGLATLGSLTFLALGILLSGFAKTAESARAMVMPLQMLFMFTGGIYFARSVLPAWLYTVSGYFPITYLADVLRDTMVKGYDLTNSGIQIGILGLTVWLVVLIGISIKTFRWEIEAR